ncbi:MAG: hypothetical protein ACRDTI_05605 [Mycobacterium sp.]
MARSKPNAYLDRLAGMNDEAKTAVLAFYDEVRRAKINGASYNDIIAETNLPRGTVQNIVDGRNPRYSVYPNIEL